MNLLLFLFQTVVISLSGVIAPGPITTVTIGTGMKSPHSGALVALGHGVVEIPLILALTAGVGLLLDNAGIKGVILLAGGAFLVLMGVDMIRAMFHGGGSSGRIVMAPFIAGIVLSAGNIYFLLWWATVGASLISRAVVFGVTGIVTFIVVHWLCDFVWLYILSSVSFKGGIIWGRRFQIVVFAVCGLFLSVFGILFIREAFILLAR
jgi:threonine/homoserine/homoserine lactone efflux protein